MEINKINLLKKFYQSFFWFFILGIFATILLAKTELLYLVMLPFMVISIVAGYKWIKAVPNFLDKSSTFISKILISLLSVLCVGLSFAFIPILYTLFK